MEKEYIITLKDHGDLDGFYHQMECECQHAHVPWRKVHCINRRPLSRNTHYGMTDQEAAALRKDPRVLAVELTPEARGLVPVRLGGDIGGPSVMQESAIASTGTQDPNLLAFNKSNILSSSYVNWGLLRSTNEQQTPDWGFDGTQTVYSTLKIEPNGRDVDVVIVDAGSATSGHPEFAVNYDGTGGSRVIPFNWYSLDQYVLGSSSGRTYSATDDYHAMHVTGTATGNRQGWARGANIYNLSYQTILGGMFDYVRAFHLNKPINPKTGRRNPTIMNNSWTYIVPGSSWIPSMVQSVAFRGYTYPRPADGYTEAQLASWGIRIGVDMPVRDAATDADLADAIAAGVICVCAAGNTDMKHDVPGGQDWNNTLTINTFSFYYMRGGSPGAPDIPNNIIVGSTNINSIETKASFSDCGPGVDIWAPGYYIESSITSSYATKVADPRNASYHLGKLSGTSMASPQVCGVVASYLERYPRWNAADAKSWLISNSMANQLSSTNGGFQDQYDLLGSPNRHLHFPREQASTGMVTPSNNYGARPQSGQAYPRSRIYRYGKVS